MIFRQFDPENLEKKFCDLPEEFAPPDRALLVAEHDSEIARCVAFAVTRPLTNAVPPVARTARCWESVRGRPYLGARRSMSDRTCIDGRIVVDLTFGTFGSQTLSIAR
jgi:hypothetical protein